MHRSIMHQRRGEVRFLNDHRSAMSMREKVGRIDKRSPIGYEHEGRGKVGFLNNHRSDVNMRGEGREDF